MTSFIEDECLIFSEYQERPLLWNVILFSSEVLFKLKKKTKILSYFWKLFGTKTYRITEFQGLE